MQHELRATRLCYTVQLLYLRFVFVCLASNFSQWKLSVAAATLRGFNRPREQPCVANIEVNAKVEEVLQNELEKQLFRTEIQVNVCASRAACGRGGGGGG